MRAEDLKRAVFDGLTSTRECLMPKVERCKLAVEGSKSLVVNVWSRFRTMIIPLPTADRFSFRQCSKLLRSTDRVVRTNLWRCCHFLR